MSQPIKPVKLLIQERGKRGFLLFNPINPKETKEKNKNRKHFHTRKKINVRIKKNSNRTLKREKEKAAQLRIFKRKICEL